MSAPDIITFGCRLNSYESEAMASRANEAGLTDAVIVNTCAVTAEAERQARQAIRRARRERPDARIIVTGCAAQIDPDTYAAMEEVDRVIGNQEKLTRAAFAPANHACVEVADLENVRETAPHLIEGFDGRSRAFVQIQQGCDHRCTFCIIPFGRGPNRSVPAGAIVDQIRLLVENGYHEIVLTGVDITGYGQDLPGSPRLGNLVRRILKLVPELDRLRLSSIDVAEIDTDLMAAIAEEDRLMPHLHLSLQAGDDMILKRMKRRHSTKDAHAFCEDARKLRPDIVFGADLIAGFPTETDDMFAGSLDIIEACGLTWLHVFPYSVRPGTPAAQMPQVPGDVRKERARRLREKGAAQAAAHMDSRVGTRAEILIETPRTGRCPDYAPVAFGTDQTPGILMPAMLAARDGDALTAKIIL